MGVMALVIRRVCEVVRVVALAVEFEKNVRRVRVRLLRQRQILNLRRGCSLTRVEMSRLECSEPGTDETSETKVVSVCCCWLSAHRDQREDPVLDAVACRAVLGEEQGCACINADAYLMASKHAEEDVVGASSVG